MASYDQIANALSGFGAGVQGQGAQFINSMQNRKLIEQEQQDKQMQLDEKRKAAMVQDAWTVNQLLDQGKAPIALKLLDSRIENIQKLKGDPSDTMAIKDALVSGDPARVAQAKQELQIFSEAGIAAGAWQPPQESLESKKFTFEQQKFKDEQKFKEDELSWKKTRPVGEAEGGSTAPAKNLAIYERLVREGNPNAERFAYASGLAGRDVDSRVTLAQREAEARAAGEGEAKRVLDAKAAEKRTTQLTEAIKQAKDLIPKATGSMAGAARDAMGRAVGVSTDASKAAARLDTLAGWMVANVPRMEGPQSNIDVENYKTMAAKVGDRTVPQEERLAALDELETLQKKYSNMNQSTISGNNQKLSGQDKQAYDWAKANPNDPRSAQILNKLGAQ